MARRAGPHRFAYTNKMLPMIVLILVSIICRLAQSSYIISIPAKDEECYIISPPLDGKPTTLHGNFDLLDDGTNSDPLSVVVIDYQKEHVIWRSRRKAKEGIFKVSLNPNQKVYLCIQNGIVTAGRGRKAPTERKHDGIDRTVGFDFNIETRNVAQELLSQSDKIIESSMDLTREILNLQTHHQYMKAREAKHREVVERTFSQLLFWMILEVAFVILIAAGQIMYFRRFLERRRYI